MVTSEQLPDWLKRQYPFKTKSYTTPHGAQMSYVDEGPHSEEAVLFLHGNPSWSFLYRDIIKTLSPKIRCIAPDHIGMGLSDKPADYPYNLAARITDIEGLVNHLGLWKVHLVVHDWGGAIGSGWAVRRPERVGRIVIFNTGAFRSPHIPLRIALCRTPVLGTFIVRALNGFAGPAVWMSMNNRKLTRDERRGFLFPYNSWGNRVAVNAFVKDIPMEDDHPSYKTLAEVELGLKELHPKPVRLIWGGADFCFDMRFFMRWQKIFPHAQHYYMPEAGHYVIDDSAPTATRLTTEFLLSK
ncbi:MAG: Haloalkane dehalogenase [Verrucomicrobia bacterium ADurb.Bin122]|nr:MAG: Haloalkane dehalogenase [Verrucomicrobia bacterium ADurb.Bin122]